MKVLQVQLINGIRAEALTKKLLAAENETLDQLLARARSFEQVERDVRASRQEDKQETNSSEPTLSINLIRANRMQVRFNRSLDQE